MRKIIALCGAAFQNVWSFMRYELASYLVGAVRLAWRSLVILPYRIVVSSRLRALHLLTHHHMSTHYAILNLPSPTSQTRPSLNSETIKLAYRHALLSSHPDKKSAPTSSPFSIDQITQAYKTLADPTARRLYDQSLLLAPTSWSEAVELRQESAERVSGLESVDLDDMGFDEKSGVWYHGCRCGKERGYMVTEGDLEGGLEDGKKNGEIVVGCGGCSLAIRVGYEAGGT